MDQDSDRPSVTRRRFLRMWAALPMALMLSAHAGPAAGGAASARAADDMPSSSPSASAAPAVDSCVVTPQMTEGPYFVDERLNRSDIRTNTSDGAMKAGVPLSLSVQVSQITADGCTPLPGATFDLWHCDALGTYSDVTDVGQGFATTGQDFLRGYQVTDANGMVQFTTIYPGWYTGRAVHAHFKVRTDPGADSGYEATSQFFFDDALTDRVHALDPYAAKGRRDTRNADDAIFQGGGDQTILPLVPQGDGYAAQYQVMVDLSAPAPAVQPNTGPGGPPSGFGGPSGRPPGGGPPGAARPPSQAPAVQVPK